MLNLEVTRCGGCKTPLRREHAEFCWVCNGSLCYDCWDARGECGHAEDVRKFRFQMLMSYPTVVIREGELC
jgi:hypothetical protein